MRSTLATFIFVLLGACVDVENETLILDAPSGKADGDSTRSFSISPAHPRQTVEIECDEWFSCDLRIQAAYALPDIAAVSSPTNVVAGVDVMIFKDGKRTWDGAAMAVVDSTGTPISNGLEDVVGERDDEQFDPVTHMLSLSGGKTSVFELGFALNDNGRRRLELAAHPSYTITVNARWW